MAQIDYAALADQARKVAPAPATAPAEPIDYAALADQARKSAPEGPSVGGFLGNAVSSAGNLASGIGSAIMHPINTLSDVAQAGFGAIEKPVRGALQMATGKPIEPTPEEAKANQVGQFYKQRYGGLSNLGHTLYTDPVGAAADAATVLSGGAGTVAKVADIADIAKAGRTAAALRTAAGVGRTASEIANPVAVPGRAIRAVARRVVPTQVSSTLNPVEQAAVDYALKAGAPVDVSNATGNNFIGSAKTILQKQPFSAGIAGRFGKSQEQWLADRAGQVAQSVAPTGAKTRLTAGIEAETAIGSKLSDYRNAASNSYDTLYQEAEAAPQVVQVGMKRNPSMDPAAPPFIPDMQALAGPTSTASVKAVAEPLLQEISGTMSEAQRQMSPSVSLLRQILSRPDHVDLRTAMADNSAIQNLARTETPQMRTQAQRIAANLVTPYRASIDAATQQLGPAAIQALQDGRTATIAKYDLGRLLPARLRGKPVTIVKLLTSGDNASVPILEKLQRHVPQALPSIARATIEDIFGNATKGGGFSKVDSTWNRWNALGEKTKQVLYGKDVSNEITQLLNFAKVTSKNLNPSGTASVGTTAALASMLLHDPMTAIAAMAGSRQLAKGIFNTDVARTVQQTGRIPTPTVPRALRVAAAPLRPGVLNTITRINPYRDDQDQVQ